MIAEEERAKGASSSLARIGAFFSSSRFLRALVSSEATFAWAIFFVAFVPRIAFAIATRGAAVWDGHYYAFGAQRIADGFGYSDDIADGAALRWHPWCHYPVGYSGFLGGVLFLARILARSVGVDLAESPVSSLVFPFANALTGALLALATYLLAKTALSERRARIAGLLVALHPGLILYSGLVMSEPLAALLIVLAFLFACRARSLRGFLLAGLWLGAGTLVRPQALLCLPFLVLPLLTRGPAFRLRLKRTLVALVAVVVGTFAPVLPWTARNCNVMDGCALVSTNAGWNLAIGASPHATGRFDSLRKEDGCREVTGQVEQDRCWLHVGLANIRKTPGRWLALMPEKWSQTFDHESFPIEYLREAGRPRPWSESIRTSSREALTAFHRVLLLLAALGGVAFVRRGRGARFQMLLGGAVLVLFIAGISHNPSFAWPLVFVAALLPWLGLVRGKVPGAPTTSNAALMVSGLLLTTLFTHAVFFGEDRYHVFVVPGLCLLAASLFRRGAVRPGDETRQRRGR